ncbi:TPA: hypothetical protein R2K49_004513 [Raoultella ornithinolytica]|nr:hypothetical protein [Raoultella ornithinolytica]
MPNKEEKLTSRNIPLPMKREIRQRCGFGCVVCGLPLYEYEHMEEWATVKRHVESEITLLCDQHHKEKTSGLLPKEAVLLANKNPHNLKKGVSKPYNLHFYGDSMCIDVGTNVFITKVDKKENYSVSTPIMIDGIPIITFVIEDGHILLNITLFDKKNNVCFAILNNQLIYNTFLWDIQLIGTKITIREKLGSIFFEINFMPPNRIEITRGKILCNGINMEISNKSVIINQHTVYSNNIYRDCHIGLGIGSRSHNRGPCSIVSQIERL